MKPSFQVSLLRWLVAAALFDWFVTRTITRAAIFMPKPPLLLLAYQGLGWLGQVALALTSLLVLSMLGWIAWREWQTHRVVGLPLLLSAQALLSLLFLFTPPLGWLGLVDHLFYLAAILVILAQIVRAQHEPASQRSSQLVAGLLPALTLLAGRLHQALPAWYATWRWPGPPPLTGALFNLGELLILLSSIALWWVYGRRAAWPVWLGAALPALAFAGAYLHNAAMTGILTVWSLGLTLYLPWPLYAFTLWCATVTVLVTLRQRDYPVGWAILLLVAGGYAPQLSVQAFLGLIALWLLADFTRQEATYPAATSVFATALPRTPTAQSIAA